MLQLACTVSKWFCVKYNNNKKNKMNIKYTKHTLFQIELRTEEQLHNDAGQVQVGFTWRVL